MGESEETTKPDPPTRSRIATGFSLITSAAQLNLSVLLRSLNFLSGERYPNPWGCQDNIFHQPKINSPHLNATELSDYLLAKCHVDAGCVLARFAGLCAVQTQILLGVISLLCPCFHPLLRAG